MPPYDYESDGYQEDWDNPLELSCGENFWDHYAAASVDADCWACPECVICGAVLRWPNEVAENAGRSSQELVLRRHSDAYLLTAMGDEQRKSDLPSTGPSGARDSVPSSPSGGAGAVRNRLTQEPYRYRLSETAQERGKPMLKPYVYVDTGKSKDIQRDAPKGARVAVHYPELGRTVELQTDAQGRWVLTDRPAPGHGGKSLRLAEGRIINFTEEV